MTAERSCSNCQHPLRPDDRFCASCGAVQFASGDDGAAHVSRWDALLERLRAAVAPRYDVVRLLGFGGMAGVYLAEETKLGRRVAIKVMAPELMVDSTLTSRFEQEARTTAQLSHPNIVTVYDVSEAAGLHYFVMAYVAGRTLGQVIADHQGPLPIGAVTHWLYQVSSALAHAHRAGVVHRDVKPGNILLDADANALVGDFGIAKVSDGPGLTRTGMLVGTPAYTSPEYCLTGAVTSASDQYSLGIVGYEMLTGTPPFVGPTLPTLQAHVSQAPPPLAERRPDCPPALCAAIERMLAKRPEDRFSDLTEAIAAMGAGPLGIHDPLRLHLSAMTSVAERITIGKLPGALAEGESASLEATVLSAALRPLASRAVEWSTEDEGVASIDAEGVLTARAAGRTRVVVRCENAVNAADVVVVPAAVEHIELVPPVGPLAPGGAVRLEAHVRGPGGAPVAAPVSWHSSNPQIAVVTGDGYVVALQPGTVEIQASTGDRSVSAVLTVAGPAGAEPPPTAPGAVAEPEAPPLPGVVPPAADATPVPVDVPSEPPPPAALRATAPGVAATPSVAPAPEPPSAAPEPPFAAPGVGAARGSRKWLAIGGAVGAVAVATIAVVLSRPPAAAPAGERAAARGSALAAGPAVPEARESPTDALGPTASAPPATVAPADTPAAAPAPASPAPAETSDATPAAESAGTLRLTRPLPGGSQVVLRGAGGEVHRLTGVTATLPPGSYRTEVTAPGYETARGTVRVRAGETTRWAPALTALAAPAESVDVPARPPAAQLSEAATGSPTPPAAAPARAAANASGAAATAEIQEVLRAFAESLESRSIAQVERSFPGASGDWLRQWRDFLQDERAVRSLDASATDIGAPEIDGSTARVGFTVELRYRDMRNAAQQADLHFQAVLRRDGDRWVLAALRN